MPKHRPGGDKRRIDSLLKGRKIGDLTPAQRDALVRAIFRQPKKGGQT
jgi:hypothetical protein